MAAIGGIASRYDVLSVQEKMFEGHCSTISFKDALQAEYGQIARDPISFSYVFVAAWDGNYSERLRALEQLHKAKEEIDTNPWHSLGLTVREELMDFPKGARASEKDRVRNFLSIPVV